MADSDQSKGGETGENGEMIVKANQLVQAKMPLTKLEHRIVGILISKLSKDDERFSYQKLPIKELREKSQKNNKALYDRAKKTCQSLLDKKLEIKRMEDGKRLYRGINLMAACEYKEGDGHIRAKFNEEMSPFLLELKRRFTMYDAGYFLPLDSVYSMRIYELLKMREGISILRLSVEELRDILGVGDSYSSFSQLKYYVIKTAQEEIQEKTDIKFTYNVEREGRSPKRIKFFIHAADRPLESRKTKMEDRTEAPNVDVIDLFLKDLTQAEISALDSGTINELYESAVEQAKRENPDSKGTHLQAETYKIMKRLWKR